MTKRYLICMKEGAISYDEAIRNADSANELRLQIKLKSKRRMQEDELENSLSLHDDGSE